MNTGKLFIHGDPESIMTVDFFGYSDTSAPRLHVNNSDFLLEYVLSGCECVESPDYLIRVGVGELIAIHPGEECVLYREHSDAVVLSFRISAFVLEAMWEVLGLPKIKVVSADIFDKIASAIPFYKRYKSGDTESGRRLLELAFSLILDAASGTAASDSREKPTAEAIKAYLDLCLCADIDLDGVGKKFGITGMHTIRLFRQKYDITPMQYLKNMRLEKSAALLRNSDMSIKDISSLLHFSNTQHFTNIFRKHFGVAPGKYRNDGYEDTVHRTR